MQIHFICSGNTYRSRLAESYLNSLERKNVKGFSSGTHAEKQLMDLRWYAERILEKNELLDHVSSKRRQTSMADLKRSDLLIFLGKEQYDFCRKKHWLSNKEFLVWDFPDVNPAWPDARLIKASDRYYFDVKKKIDKLTADAIY